MCGCRSVEAWNLEGGGGGRGGGGGGAMSQVEKQTSMSQFFLQI